MFNVRRWKFLPQGLRIWVWHSYRPVILVLFEPLRGHIPMHRTQKLAAKRHKRHNAANKQHKQLHNHSKFESPAKASCSH